jgi:hypothetical protein
MRDMAEQDHTQIWKALEAADQEVDRVLDAALAKYAAVEPRAGLEARILTNLRAKQTRTPNHFWWRWRLAAAVIAILVVALSLAWRSGKPAHPDATVQASPQSSSTQLASNRGGGQVREDRLLPQKHLVQRAAVHLSRPEAVGAAVPKLDQFPSPRPLSEQEKLLRSYVAEDPEQAVLIARARSEALRQDQLEEIRAFQSGNHDWDSEQDNRHTTER